MKNKKSIKKESDILCQYNPLVHIKNNTASGITLIALIITIIVLLILAGISIASFVGDKGLLNETKDMKNSIEDLQNQTINDLQSIANELSTSTGDALDPENPGETVTPGEPESPGEVEGEEEEETEQ